MKGYTCRRAVLADAAVGQRLVEDHMIVTATMVQLKGRNGALESEAKALREELVAVSVDVP